uniref:DUF4360 domain-containing protein n=1 Tax=Phenylobacterium glaciei TaxID=2803784 RepID=A0A974P5D0_9CAUL|nr:DUF4360 domain-containing protein [Phenylobacterium glaciei]
MKAKIMGLVAIGALAVAGSASAQNDIALGTPGYGGSGCPSGSVSATLSPDNRSLSLIFDDYQVSAGGTTGRSFDRKSCNVAIPVFVPEGYSVSVLSVDYRGFNRLPPRASSQFNVEYFFAGGRGGVPPHLLRRARLRLPDQQRAHCAELGLVTCGADVNLRTNSSMRVNTVNNAEAMATVDSQDVNAAIVYRLNWRRC